MKGESSDERGAERDPRRVGAYKVSNSSGEFARDQPWPGIAGSDVQFCLIDFPLSQLTLGEAGGEHGDAGLQALGNIKLNSDANS